MAYYDRKRPPPDKSELPAALVALMEDALDPVLYGDGGVHTGQARPSKPGAPVTARKPPWSRVVVLIPETAFPRGRPMPDRSEIARVQIVAEAVGDPEQLAGWDYARAIAAIHRKVFKTINGRTLELDRAEPASPIWFHRWVNEVPVRRDASRTWVQSAEYRVVLRGVI